MIIKDSWLCDKTLRMCFTDAHAVRTEGTPRALNFALSVQIHVQRMSSCVVIVSVLCSMSDWAVGWREIASSNRREISRIKLFIISLVECALEFKSLNRMPGSLVLLLLLLLFVFVCDRSMFSVFPCCCCCWGCCCCWCFYWRAVLSRARVHPHFPYPRFYLHPYPTPYRRNTFESIYIFYRASLSFVSNLTTIINKIK